MPIDYSQPKRETLHAIAVRDAQGLRLVARVVRRPSGIYYLIPRDAKAFQIESDKNWDPHVSYHADGSHHIKSFGQLALTRMKRQPLNSTFSGAEPLFAHSFQPGDLHNLPMLSNASSFVDVFEIPVDRLTASDHYTFALDLLEPGAERLGGPWLEVVLELSFQDASPWIHATLWRGPESFAVP